MENQTTELTVFENAITKFDIQEHVFDEIESFEVFECIDTNSRKNFGKQRQNAKTLRKKIDDCRRKINRDHKEKTDKYASILLSRVTKSINIFDEKIKAYDEELEKKRAEKARIEQERLDEIQYHIENLKICCNAGIQYNLCSEAIKSFLDRLKNIEIGEEYQERTEEAKEMLAKGIENTTKALINREKWEAEQKEIEKQKAIQEENERRLAEQQAKFEAEQAKIRAEQKKKEEEAARLAAQEAEKLRLKQEALAKERKAIEDERKSIEAAKKAEELKKEISILYDEAIILNAEFDEKRRQERIEKLKADKARAELVNEDKQTIKEIANNLDAFISEITFPGIKTNKAEKLILNLISNLKSSIADFEEAGQNLI